MEWIKRHGYSLALFCVIVLVMLYGFQSAAESSAAENLRMTEDSLRRAVVSCYALEGQYPPDIAYLQEQYGLQIDMDRYMVHYEVFAENIMPDITVLER